MKKIWKKTTAVALAGVVSVGMLSGCGQAKLDGTKTVATVDGTEIPMGVLSLAVRTQQAMMESWYSYYIQAGYMTSIWDQTVDDAGEETYGQQMISSMLEELEEWCLLRSHASDYSVELTADEEKAIADAAAKFMSDNTEEAIAELAVTEDQVKEYLELTTYHEKMHPAIEAEADTEVSDEEAQQSSFSYVLIPLDEEETEESEVEEAETEDTDESVESDEAEDTDLADSDATEDADETEVTDADVETEAAADTAVTEVEATETESTDGEVEDTTDTDPTESENTDEENTMDALTKAEEILKALQADPDADLTEIAQSVDSTLSASTGSFDANVSEEETDDEEEEEDSYSDYPEELIEALRSLKDKEVLSEVLTTDNGYYVARLDEVFDQERTEEKKEEIVSERQSEHYTEVVDGWKEAAKITTNDKVLATLTLTDSHTFTQKVEETEEDEAAEEDVVTEDDIVEEEAASEDNSAEESVTEDETEKDETTSTEESTQAGE